MADQFKADSVDVAVLHVPTIKPLDEATILAEVARPGGLVGTFFRVRSYPVCLRVTW